MRAALARKLEGIDSVELGELPDPVPAAGQVLIRVRGAGVGLWDVGFVSGGFPGVALPFVPGQEVAGVVEAAGDGSAGIRRGERVYGTLFPTGGGFAQLALASADRIAPMPESASFQEAAGLVISAGTAYEALVDRGRLRVGETVLITAAAGGVGSAAVQIAVAQGARVCGVASPGNHEYVRGLGASDVFDYHAADWVQQVRARVPGSSGTRRLWHVARRLSAARTKSAPNQPAEPSGPRMAMLVRRTTILPMIEPDLSPFARSLRLLRIFSPSGSRQAVQWARKLQEQRGGCGGGRLGLQEDQRDEAAPSDLRA